MDNPVLAEFKAKVLVLFGQCQTDDEVRAVSLRILEEIGPGQMVPQSPERLMAVVLLITTAERLGTVDEMLMTVAKVRHVGPVGEA